MKKKKNIAVYANYSKVFGNKDWYMEKLIKYINKQSNFKIRFFHTEYQREKREYKELITEIFEKKVDTLVLFGTLEILPTNKETLENIRQTVKVVEL